MEMEWNTKFAFSFIFFPFVIVGDGLTSLGFLTFWKNDIRSPRLRAFLVSDIFDLHFPHLTLRTIQQFKDDSLSNVDEA